MKTVGIIGGLSPESTMLYYNGINEGVRERLGGHHCGKVLIHSLDFGEFVAYKALGDWGAQRKLLCEAAMSLENAGADFVILATNTMHKMADHIENSISIPFLHLADETAREIRAHGFDKVGLLGTRYTMELDFYKGRLAENCVHALVPNEVDRKIVHDAIYDELCHGVVKDKSRAEYVRIINEMKNRGAQGVILGCTEISMLIKPDDVEIEVFDTTQIHVQGTLDCMFER